jgi:hypothetical protein
MSSSLDHRTTLARAKAGRDNEIERTWVIAILTAIADASRITDRAAVAIRTGETASPLLSCLATILAMPPAATDSPIPQRALVDDLRKRLRRRVAAVETCPDFADFLQRCFRGSNYGGHA